MVIRPLCASDDLGEAVAYADRRYRATKGGARPAIFTRVVIGSTTGDTFICRTVLAANEDQDQVSIFKIPYKIPQEITITVDEWDTPDVGDTPFVAGVDVTVGHGMVLGATGTLTGTGGGSGNPVVLSSSNTSVCTVSGSTITLVGWGRCYFTLSQAGNTRYSPVSISGTVHFFPQETQFFGTGGVVVGGGATFRAHPVGYRGQGGVVVGGASRAFKGLSFIGSGGVVVSGEAVTHSRFIFQASGGVVAGGTASFAIGRVFFGGQGAAGVVAGGSALSVATLVPVPKALSFSVSVPYASRTDYGIKLQGTGVRGGVLTYQITAIGPNCTIDQIDANGAYVPDYAYFSSNGTWTGTTYFYYTVTETLDDLAIYSAAAKVTVSVAAAVPLSYVVAARTANEVHIAVSGGTPQIVSTGESTYRKYNASIVGTTQGITLVKPAISGLFQITFGCTTSGYLRVTDFSNPVKTLDILLSAIGVPACSIVTPPATGLRFTYINGGKFRFTNDGRGPITWTFVNSSISYQNNGWYSPNVYQITILGVCFNAGGGIRITDQFGGNVFHAFVSAAQDGLPPCPGNDGSGNTVPAGWTNIYSRPCEVALGNLYHATNLPGGVSLEDGVEGWGVYYYVNGNYQIKMACTPVDGEIAGLPGTSDWHSFSAAMEVLTLNGVADPVSAFDIYAWENIFGSLESGFGSNYDRWGKLHVVSINKKN